MVLWTFLVHGDSPVDMLGRKRLSDRGWPSSSLLARLARRRLSIFNREISQAVFTEQDDWDVLGAVARPRWSFQLTPIAGSLHDTGIITFAIQPWALLSAGMLLLLLLLPKRYHYRPGSSKCPVCSYSRLGLGQAAACPECGWNDGQGT